MFTTFCRCALAAGWYVVLVMVAPGTSAQSLSGEHEYARIDYFGPATDNPVARLAVRIDSGALRLEGQGERGYLDSLLEALGISAASQVLVYSPTSLQRKLISRARPRALYFSEDTYVGWVQGSDIIELVTIDAQRGLVFYTFANQLAAPPVVERENRTCLICHDSAALLGGGVPQLLARSALYSDAGTNLRDFSGTGNVTDQSPLDQRWGGWYVSGRHGAQTHMGNLVLQNPAELAELEQLRRGNLDSLDGAGLFNTAPYPRTTSDIVALMIFEHQLTVQNQLSYVKLKAPAVLERSGHAGAVQAETWDALPAQAQQSLTRMLDRLVQALLFSNAAPLQDQISGSAEFAEWFEAQGPRDGQGRSLRELDLQTRLFKYPLSYLIVGAGFRSLPGYARDYVFQQVAVLLASPAGDLPGTSWTEAERQEALTILRNIEMAASP